MAARYEDFVQLVESLAEVPAERGVRIIDARFRESFHPWAEVFRGVREHALAFRREGVGQRQRVLLSLTTSFDSIVSFLGLVYLGAVPVSVPPPLFSQDRQAHLLGMAEVVRHCGIDRILDCPGLRGLAGSARDIPAALALAPSGACGAERGNAATLRPAVVAPDDVAFVQFSSGSTSRPRGVRITHRNLVYNIDLIVRIDRRTPESVWVSWPPLSHDMGLVGCLFTNLSHKHHLVLMDPLAFITRPLRWLSAVSRYGGTVTAVPNFALDVCTERIDEGHLRESGIDLSRFRCVYCGSEPVRVRSIRRFEERFAPYGFVPGSIYPVYGMSETTLVVSAPRLDRSLTIRRVGDSEIPSVGYPLGDFEVEVRGEDGSPRAPTRDGEIWIRGTSVTPGYLGAVEPAGSPARDGWLATGDLGLLDAEGRLYITGRKKDLIIHQGQNFHGHDVAARIEDLPFVARGKAHVFSFDTGAREEIVVMTVPPRGDASADEGELADAIRRFVLAEFGLPVHDVCFVPRLPKTTSGKIARHRCLELYREHRRERATGGA